MLVVALFALLILARRTERPRPVAHEIAADVQNAESLLELARLLRSDRRLYVRGIARLDLLLIDGTGPVFTDRRGEALARELELARSALSA